MRKQSRPAIGASGCCLRGAASARRAPAPNTSARWSPPARRAASRWSRRPRSTPRRFKLIRELLADPQVVVTRGRTADNAKHLAPAFLDQIVRRYQGTRLGRQELDGELLDDMPGALWSHGLIDAARVATAPGL